MAEELLYTRSSNASELVDALGYAALGLNINADSRGIRCAGFDTIELANLPYCKF